MDRAPKDRWDAMWAARLGTWDTKTDQLLANFYDKLIRLYSSGRAYHNLSHVMACLDELNTVTNLSAQSIFALKFAIFCHNAIYNINRFDNENRSAWLAVDFLFSIGISDGTAKQVQGLILATEHKSGVVLTPDQQLICDIDLVSLGQPPAIFDRYNQAIRREYSRYSDDEYAAGRVVLFEAFLQQPYIYHTLAFQQKYEQPARRNLQRAIAALQQSPQP
ncbi:N-methyl-D-aspartate receptor NMDAR2C subunit [Candidatus Saccharibacteria bacterium]|nr:N-methyl-D-aspartate receptor NMDAR2C subunit [Candidatus Saccharibacteria bacterium]